MMKRYTCLLSALLICIVLPLGALSADSGAVQDSAAVLKAETLRDLRELSRRSEAETGIALAVETRHFLGGADVQAYAARLLKGLSDPDNSLLLLMVIGEESYALAAGSGAERWLNAQARETLLSTRFRPAYLDRDYDRALVGLFLSAAERIAAAKGAEVRTNDLFGREAPAVTAAPTAAPRPTYKVIDLTGPNSILGESVRPQRTDRPDRGRDDEDRGLSIGGIVILGLVLSMVFGRKGDRRGCGCGPLGWILGAFGLSKLFGWRR